MVKYLSVCNLDAYIHIVSKSGFATKSHFCEEIKQFGGVLNGSKRTKREYYTRMYRMTSKNKRNNTDRLEIVKYCKFCKKRTTHKETK